MSIMLLIDQQGVGEDLRERVDVITNLTDFAAMADQWGGLLKKSTCKAPFNSHEWLFSWWNIFADKASKELYILRVYMRNKIIAIAPFYIDTKKCCLSGNSRMILFLGQSRKKSESAVAEQQDIIVEKGYERVAIKGLINFLRYYRKDWAEDGFMV